MSEKEEVIPLTKILNDICEEINSLDKFTHEAMIEITKILMNYKFRIQELEKKVNDKSSL